MILDQIIAGEALAEMQKLPDNSIDLIYTDPPYFKVKGEAWDRQWETPAKFLDWIGQLCQEWQRILKPNGSLYVFASPKMAARVECKIGEYFNILSNIRWIKEDGWHKKSVKEELRSYLSPWEACIFAEHYGSDNIAKGVAGYAAKCDELRGFLFEPIRAYLDGERKRAGIKREDCNAACGFARIPGGMASRHYFSSSQWCLPTKEHYAALQELFNQGKDPEYLRREYEYLRRPFSVTSEVPYTDVWDFPTVQFCKGKHPCEKPLDMHRHVITASSRPGAVVLDCFGGSCKVADVCLELGRHYLVIEQNSEYTESAIKRLSKLIPSPTAPDRKARNVQLNLKQFA